ncbi:MAG TPA: alpha-L-fucosidase [Gemmatimonadales bacterium]|jgi:alpha-L-fucosidase|nr:alpha-L-fucosidase [Gemmatimonadales bacterium]
MPINRREFLAATGTAFAFPPVAWLGRLPRQTTRPVPSPAQLEWQRDELALFLHFGVNTFTDQEWGTGREDPKLFAPAKLDARQWTRAAKAGGFRTLVLTAKHHDGFCLWPSHTTKHTVASSAWREGKGDVVREFTDACHAEGVKAGLYLSPWDRNNPFYGDSPRYNDLYCDQLTELLSNYGPIHEVWFDGANGEGPNGKRQLYDWPKFWGLVRRLQPQAVMFSDAGPDIRWIGNERGSAGETNWSTMDPAVVPYPGASGPGIIRALQEGNPSGAVWRPGETDVSIRPGWFYHPAEDARVKSADDLVQLYFTSVGRNSKLLLNVPPTRDGLLHDIDSGRLVELHERLGALFARDLVRRDVKWRMTGARTATADTELGRLVSVGITDLREDIEHGQVIARYVLEGSDGGPWQTLSRGTTIGYRKLDRFEPVPVRRVRLVIEDAVAVPQPVRIGLFSP